jgi:hypothetical protein
MEKVREAAEETLAADMHKHGDHPAPLALMITCPT